MPLPAQDSPVHAATLTRRPKRPNSAEGARSEEFARTFAPRLLLLGDQAQARSHGLGLLLLRLQELEALLVPEGGRREEHGRQICETRGRCVGAAARRCAVGQAGAERRGWWPCCTAASRAAHSPCCGRWSQPAPSGPPQSVGSRGPVPPPSSLTAVGFTTPRAPALPATAFLGAGGFAEKRAIGVSDRACRTYPAASGGRKAGRSESAAGRAKSSANVGRMLRAHAVGNWCGAARVRRRCGHAGD